MPTEWILSLCISLPLLFAALVAFLPARRAKMVALLGTLLPLLLILYASFAMFQWNFSGIQLALTDAPYWFRPLGIRYDVGVDSVAMLLLMLTGLLGPICVIASFNSITERKRTYYASLLVLQAAMTGVFCARDIILFYVCFEFTLVPMFVLISLWGSTNRRKAAIKFFLYTFTGSVIALAGLVYVAWANTTQTGHPGAGLWTFNIDVLAQAGRALPAGKQAWVLLALMAGFAVKVPLFPLHTWLPLAHTEAPTAGSVILAGVLLKLGTYAIFRFVLPFVPQAVLEYAPAIAVLCIIGILYGGLICWIQTDVKKLVAYSSVAHLGFCVLGLFALNATGLAGGILYMINHGLSTGALFLLIGMIYERYHTRSMKELGGLASRMPIWATFMVFFAMASVGLPGLNGFVSEFLCLLGAFQASNAWGSGLWNSMGMQVGSTGGELGPWFAAIAGSGMIIAAMYLLAMVGKIVWGPLREPHTHHDSHTEPARDEDGEVIKPLPRDLNGREIGILLPLAALCIFLGVYPKPMLDVLREPLDNTAAIMETTRRSMVSTIPAPAPVLHEQHGTTHNAREEGRP